MPQKAKTPTVAEAATKMSEILPELARRGTAQNRKVYARHGMPTEKLLGVSFAELNALAKKIKRDQPLAEALWLSETPDARHLALLIADPSSVKESVLDQWARDLGYYLVADMLARVAAQTPFAEKKLKQWTGSKSEWIGRAGYGVLAQLAMGNPPMDDDAFLGYLALIEMKIHTAKNFTRHAMMMALIAIGGRNEALWAAARAAAARIGTVKVDHGETGCKTPEPIAYMQRMWDRKRAKPKPRR